MLVVYLVFTVTFAKSVGDQR